MLSNEAVIVDKDSPLQLSVNRHYESEAWSLMDTRRNATVYR